jgi:hypothetical protein
MPVDAGQAWTAGKYVSVIQHCKSIITAPGFEINVE